LFDRLAEMDDYFENPTARESYRLHSNLAYRYLEEVSKKATNKTALSRLKKGREGISFDHDNLCLLVDPKIFKKTYYWKKFRLITQNQNWDGWWRVVIFDIPEKERKLREMLRYYLKTAGFVYWQKSVWVTVFDIQKELEEVIKKIGIEDWVIVLQSKNIGPLTNQEIIRKFFPLRKVNSSYKNFIMRVEKALRMGKRSLLEKLSEEFVGLICQDPGVPAEFLERPDLRQRAISLFRQVMLQLNS
jgi:DNA-binding transcriptional regulator PaaX